MALGVGTPLQAHKYASVMDQEVGSLRERKRSCGCFSPSRLVGLYCTLNQSHETLCWLMLDIRRWLLALLPQSNKPLSSLRCISCLHFNGLHKRQNTYTAILQSAAKPKETVLIGPQRRLAGDGPNASHKSESLTSLRSYSCTHTSSTAAQMRRLTCAQRA